jgi:hypothetical protein
MSQPPSTTISRESADPDNPGNGGNVHRSVWSNVSGKAASSFAWLTLTAFVGLLAGLFAGYAASDLPIAKQADLPSMNQCVIDTSNLFSQKNSPTSETLRDARDHCYSLIQAQGMLGDFAIRKLNFFQQYRANGVFMLLVVAVTVSGVLLAAVQLGVSYQLAAASKTSPIADNNSELILERGRLVLKSSITGLFILLISFCFFLVFVLYVYRFEAPVASYSAPSPIPTLPSGGLGPPPKKGEP